MRSPATVANFAVLALASGCAANLGSAPGIEGWLRQRGFGPARPDVAALFPAGAESSVWALQFTGINMAVVFGRDGLLCRVYAQGADSGTARASFVGIVEGVRRPGVLVEKETDGVQVQGGRQVEQIGYRIRAEARDPGRPDRMMVLTTNRAADARFAFIGTAAVIRPQ